MTVYCTISERLESKHFLRLNLTTFHKAISPHQIHSEMAVNQHEMESHIIQVNLPHHIHSPQTKVMKWIKQSVEKSIRN